MNINSIVIGTFFLLGKYLLVPRGFPMSFGFKSFHSHFLSNHVSSEIPDSVTNVCPIQLCPQTIEHTKQAVCEHQKRGSPSFLQHRRMQHRRGVSCHSQDSGHTQDMILYTKSQSWFSLFCSGYIQSSLIQQEKTHRLDVGKSHISSNPHPNTCHYVWSIISL